MPEHQIEYSNAETAPRASSLDALKICDKVELIPFDLRDGASIRNALEASAPDEIYNLAAQSSVARSWQNPIESAEINALGALRLFQAVREVCPDARVFQASSSEMFGAVCGAVDEDTPLRPLNPYGAAKAHAHHVAVGLRETGALAISCGILFNHESPLRSETFVTRKITQGAARIKAGLQHELALGDLDVVRDWGFAGDFVQAMWLTLQREPADFLIATGVARPLRDWVDEAFRAVDLKSEDYVTRDAAFFRPNETPPLVADMSQSSTRLGWTPRLSFPNLVKLMVDADMSRVTGRAEVDYFAD